MEVSLHYNKVKPIVFSLLICFSIIKTLYAEDISMVYLGIGHGEQALENEVVQSNSMVDVNYFFKRYGFEKFENSFLLLGLGYTYLVTDAPMDKELHVVSILPTYRYYFEFKNKRCFINLTAGPGYMSSKNLGYMEQGSKFIFNDYVGIGMVKGNFEFMFLFRHLSNGGIAPPNFGLNSNFNLSVSLYF